MCGVYDTIEAAQEWYKYNLFNPAAVFELPDGGYSLAYIREQNWPPHETAREVERIAGYKMVSCHDPLLGVWRPYQGEELSE